MADRTIPRQSVKVSMLLSDGRKPSGDIQIDLNSRLSDFMNEPGDFIAIQKDDGTTMLLNKKHIVDICMM
jgi:hypothetical protein